MRLIGRQKVSANGNDPDQTGIAEEMLFDIAKGQDTILHNASAELGVKTSLYLVFTAFTFNASVQVVMFAKELPPPGARYSVISSSISGGISLLAGIMLLIAALIRQYWVFFLARSTRLDHWH